MRQEICPLCKNLISSKDKLFQSSYPLSVPTAITNEEIVSLKQPKNSTSHETLVKVPLQQSGIYGLLYGLPIAITLTTIVNGNFFAIAPSTVFLVTGIAWTWHSRFFNSLLKPSVEIKEKFEKEDNSDQKPVTIEVTDRKNRTMTTGSIPAEVATTKQIIDFAKNVKRDVERRPRKDIHLTQVRFTKFPSKIFSQPSWTEFIRILEGRKLVERKNRDAKNSPYILTRTGLDFIYKFSELEL